MDNATATLLASLKPELVMGPGHHRFRLKALKSTHALGPFWEAEDLSTTQPTPVNLLFLDATLLATSGFSDKFRTLLNQSRNLKDKHAARCYGLFTWRGLLFASWEAMDGLTLAQMFESGSARKLKDKQKQGLVTQVASALEGALRQTGSPHATLCPELIYVNRSNGMRVMGFGWRDLIEPVNAKLAQPLSYHAWQSPEAFHPYPLTATEDVFALACLVYQLYAGRPAFSAAEDETSREQELKAPSGLSKEQWRVLKTALVDDPGARPKSPLELVRQLYQPQPEKPAEPEISEEADLPETADEAASKETPEKTRRFSLPRLPALPPWSKPVALGAGLFAAGFVLGYLLSPDGTPDAETIDGFTAPLASENQQLREELQQLQLSYEQLEQSANAVNETAESDKDGQTDSQNLTIEASAEPGVESAEALRNADKPADNLTVFRDEWDGGGFAPEMVVIPKGRFQMGDLHGQGDDNEYPVHEVVLSTSFAFSRHEVTFAEYDQFASATGRRLPDDEGWGRGEQPVVNVSWHDASAYANWLAEVTGQPYRLPSEAEWEYVARAGTETIYWWGDELSPGMAVCDGCGTQWDATQPSPVGSTAANPWGIHDMNGNVDEWVADCYLPRYSETPRNGSAQKTSGCDQRIMRGGSWFDIPRVIRSASRYRHPPNTSRNSWGFRVALDLPAFP
ncbi:SUMF1/EgtB/PvdO family nonheme iron enzyme [Marinobacterium lutimaris]|uniref:Formylglycine-generating enzyme, required for sulfatase activity, contains SUMF1/FGE domain n=1 Tax=Marinobacterium lutimaris TaxID=568106 RepID=A0A1H6C7L3_9GAMM|nr:SUMF1/EgtB/PvdO family nonheme iron enzyme [Marinobacterium lutimaris]SEG68951.1 Formylglycine-generating enzyme, required for sulfatase activity, contains SUMF1/FGE domain [Marinobacterium lutimaris]